MELTRIDLNTWLIHGASETILLDPWLVDPLVFYGQSWLFRATHNIPPPPLPPLDLILRSQGLEDHCHLPSLATLDHTIPVVGSPSAVRALMGSGFTNVTALPWEQTYTHGSLKITAVPGAEIQGQRENGYLIQSGGTTLYYEPHLTPPSQYPMLRQQALDVLLIPVVGQLFPLLGEVIMGPARAMALVQAVQPRLVIPTTVGDIEAEGILAQAIRTVGTLVSFADGLSREAPAVRFYAPAPGERFAIP